MLYNLNWLNPGQAFPPECEAARIERYRQNAKLFDGDHFDSPIFRTHDSVSTPTVSVYQMCSERISRVIGNFDDVVSFPVLLNYQRLMSLKMADLVCGEYPTISGADSGENEALRDVREEGDFDAKVYSTVIDISRYGDAVWRIYKDWNGRYNFTCWDPTQWYPIVRQDGTNTVIKHCLCWLENKSEDPKNPDWYLRVQIHGCMPEDYGFYEWRLYKMNETATAINELVESGRTPTGLNDRCAVQSLKAYGTTNSVYGYDDYMTVDSLLAEIMVRIGQISGILDKHADPSMTGPASMLKQDPVTGEWKLQSGKFYAVTDGEDHPEYLTWDGQLTSAFKQLEFLVNQLYILSELGAALLGGQDGSAQAVSGTAMRFKMVNPLAKARRVANSLTRPTKQLFSSLSISADLKEVTEAKPKLPIPVSHISVSWADGLPDDPRENIEMAKLATGLEKMMPHEKAIMEYFDKSNEEAVAWMEMLRNEAKAALELQQSAVPQDTEGATNHSGPQDGTGINPRKKGSEMGLNNFHSQTNGGAE